jgi:hypothetical protein
MTLQRYTESLFSFRPWRFGRRAGRIKHPRTRDPVKKGVDFRYEPDNGSNGLSQTALDHTDYCMGIVC